MLFNLNVIIVKMALFNEIGNEKITLRDNLDWFQESELCCRFCAVKFATKKVNTFNEECDICKLWFFNGNTLRKHRKAHWCFHFEKNGFVSL